MALASGPYAVVAELAGQLLQPLAGSWVAVRPSESQGPSQHLDERVVEEAVGQGHPSQTHEQELQGVMGCASL